MQQLEAGQELLTWLRDAGGLVHPALELRMDEDTGLSAFTSREVGAAEQLISCPFDLAITIEVATGAICSIYGIQESELHEWNERMRIVTYLVLHHVHSGSSDWPEALGHLKYVNSLPSADLLLTPLHYSEPELELLQGTNMYGAIEAQRALWKSESERINEAVKDPRLTWDLYLLSATHYQSRAFPSRLLKLATTSTYVNAIPEPSTEDESYPMLLPGVDIFNHARGQPVTWLSTSIPSAEGSCPSVVVLDRGGIREGVQVFNNYGPKSNEEFLFSYGFVLDPNPDDTVTLKVSSGGMTPEGEARLKERRLDANRKFVLRLDSPVPQDLLRMLRVVLGEEVEVDNNGEDEDDLHAEHEREVKTVELELDVLGLLGSMLEDKLAKLPPMKEDSTGVREEVARMCRVYVQGQSDILSNTITTVIDKIDQLENMLDQGMGECPCCS
ncbi:putative cytoplasm protein [Kockovaella imperatae]|uniref:Putative cytoplasm protein n=1 Tax=Kockovaella imperatae TaxID=4999 RepID=A0A1Y1U738_9TREE|nr:putative cytoplasm protein [Kockovaella imperatae]ORX33849.1 putative cytoplasm protein [Kockovaella imperatae]